MDVISCYSYVRVLPASQAETIGWLLFFAWKKFQFSHGAGGRGAGVAAADGGGLLQTGAQPQQRAATAQAQPLEPQVSAAAPTEDEGERQAPQPIQYPFTPAFYIHL